MMGCRAAVRVLNMLVGDRTGRESGGGSSAAPEGMEMDSELDQLRRQTKKWFSVTEKLCCFPNY